jgi:hypothetical protein
MVDLRMSIDWMDKHKRWADDILRMSPKGLGKELDQLGFSSS